ncbi:MAG: MerR family transcriptional regulator [Deltaproteobacteria bacterium]|nr:MerR family transcriptional regulator [Deltaproteobacteria bacterium]
MPVTIPDKLYFKIGEVAHLTGVRPHVLRYWESMFNIIRPVKSKTNQRMYRRKDVETVLMIKNMLYNEKYTIAGARRKLKQNAGGETRNKQLDLNLGRKEAQAVIEEAVRDLESMLQEVEKLEDSSTV